MDFNMAAGCVSLVFLLLSLVFGKIEGCKNMDFQTLLHNKALINHVIKTQKTSSDLECQSKCFLDDRCISNSFGTSASGETGMCELSDSDHLMHPDDLVDRPGVIYRSTQNTCQCPVGGNFKCRFNFANRTHRCECKPGFTGSDCKTTGVWTQWTPWSACHDLPDCPRTRTRNCTNPAAPQNIGTNCSGSAVDSDNTTCQVPTVNTTGCENPLGMEDGTILDSQINASSFFRNLRAYAPQEARLNNQPGIKSGSWASDAAAIGEYIQIDLGSVKMVTKIATQGRNPFYIAEYYQWVTEYSVSYSNDTSDWADYRGDCVKRFPGNSNSNTVVTNKLEIPITARYIRVIVQKWNTHPSMRVELYGCTLPRRTNNP